jgi:multidrug efflux system membrane fusion protein
MSVEHPPTEQPAPAEQPAAPAIERQRPQRRRRRFLIWAAIVAGFVGVFWWALHAGGKPDVARGAPPPVTVVTATAALADLPIYLDAIGTVTPIYTASVTSQVAGRVVAVRYAEGQLVERGAALVDIDPRPFAATLMQAEGTLERDQHVLEQARMDLERYRAAWAQHAIARQQLDDQEKIAEQAQGTVKVDRGVVAYDRVQLGYCHITAPIAGRVGLRLVDPGNVVAANTGPVLAVITQAQPISVVFSISEDHLGDVRGAPDHGAGMPVTVLDRVKAVQLATGRLTTIDNQIDPTTGTVRLRAVFDNRDDALFPNQFVNTRLLVRTLRGAIVLPSSAIQRSTNQAFVYAIVEGKAHVQPVTVGAVEGLTSQVTGVAPGAVVANSSFEKLREGAPVTAARPPPARQPLGSLGP